MNCELPDFKLDLEKAEEPEIKLPTSVRSSKNQESFSLINYAKDLTVWITIHCGKFERDGNTRTPDLPLKKPVCRSGNKS